LGGSPPKVTHFGGDPPKKRGSLGIPGETARNPPKWGPDCALGHFFSLKVGICPWFGENRHFQPRFPGPKRQKSHFRGPPPFLGGVPQLGGSPNWGPPPKGGSRDPKKRVFARRPKGFASEGSFLGPKTGFSTPKPGFGAKKRVFGPKIGLRTRFWPQKPVLPAKNRFLDPKNRSIFTFLGQKTGLSRKPAVFWVQKTRFFMKKRIFWPKNGFIKKTRRLLGLENTFFCKKTRFSTQKTPFFDLPSHSTAFWPFGDPKNAVFWSIRTKKTRFFRQK